MARCCRIHTFPGETWKNTGSLAQQYVLGDHMFQSNTGPSFVAHQYMIAGQSGDVAENPTGSVWGCDAAPGTTAALIGPNGTELPGVFPCFDYQTTADLLDRKGVTWRYYAPGSGDNFFLLSAYQAVRHIRFGKDWDQNVISPSRRVLVDIKAGELAQVTWIVPDFAHSDHPGSGSEGPAWIAAIVNAIGNSPYWNSTAIFISWDDWGGWYDHVSPTKVDAMGPGFRVPLLIVSPYAKHGYITHHFHEASGFIAFIEHNFDLGTLGARDAGTDAFSDCFDYTQTPTPLCADSHQGYGGTDPARSGQRAAGRRLSDRHQATHRAETSSSAGREPEDNVQASPNPAHGIFHLLSFQVHFSLLASVAEVDSVILHESNSDSPLPGGSPMNTRVSNGAVVRRFASGVIALAAVAALASPVNLFAQDFDHDFDHDNGFGFGHSEFHGFVLAASF